MNKIIQKAISLCGNQQALAEKCGVTQSTISFWLNGKGISGKYISKIAAATDYQISESEILQSLAED